MNENNTNNRRRQNRRQVYGMLVVWAILFMLDPSMTGDVKNEKTNKSKKSKVSVQSSDYKTSTGPAGTGTNTNLNNNNVNNDNDLLSIYRDFIIKPIGDNGASVILNKATREKDGISMFPKNISVNLRGWWKRTTKRAPRTPDE